MGWAAFEMAKDGDDEPILTEPEIVRVIAVGGYRIRVDGDALLLEVWETLPGEKRIVARLSFQTEMALGAAGDIRKILPRKTN